MPSPEHEAILEAFRRDPDLAVHLLELCQIPIPEGAAPKIVEASLDQLQPTEFRADLVIELCGGARVVLSIVLEVQLSRDPDKKFSWPEYVAARRARTRAPVVLLVVAPDVGVAAWAKEPIELGPQMGSLTPLVLDSSRIPRITDHEQALAEPELSFLSAMAHGNDPDGLDVVLALLEGLKGVDPALATVYFAAVYRALRDKVRKVVEERVMSMQNLGAIELPPFMQRMAEESEAKGKLKGKAEGEAEAILKFLAARGVAVGEEARERILACRDLDTLNRWISRAAVAQSIDEVLRDP